MANFDEGGNFVPSDPRPPIEDSSFQPDFNPQEFENVVSSGPDQIIGSGLQNLIDDQNETFPHGPKWGGLSTVGPQKPNMNFDSKPLGPIDRGFSVPQPVNVPQGFLAPPRPIVGGGFSAPAPIQQGRGFQSPGSLESIYTNAMTPREAAKKALQGPTPLNEDERTISGPDYSVNESGGLDSIRVSRLGTNEEIQSQIEALKEARRQSEIEASFGEPVGFDMRYVPVHKFDPLLGVGYDPGTGLRDEPSVRKFIPNPDRPEGYNSKQFQDLARQIGVPRDEEQIAAEEGRVTDSQKAFNDQLREEIARREQALSQDPKDRAQSVSRGRLRWARLRADDVTEPVREWISEAAMLWATDPEKAEELSNRLTSWAMNKFKLSETAAKTWLIDIFNYLGLDE